MTGQVHSIESFGTVDGPGVRLVVFLQGCPMRCLYCHNPDTWEPRGGRKMEAEEILRLFIKNRAFYKNGGITVSGGEPLLQLDFLIDLFTLCKGEGIHTCIDTSGIIFDPKNLERMRKLDKLVSLTDLFLLDIKHTDSAEHKRLTGMDCAPVLGFAEYLDSKGAPFWVRRVVVAGYTDSEEELLSLGRLLAHFRSLKAVEVLPYHTMGRSKYKELGIEYPLGDMPPLDKGAVELAKKTIIRGMNSV